METRKAKQRAHKRANIPGYTDERQTAEELGVGLRTLRKWRQQGVGPAYVKIGKKIYYRDEARAAWVRAQEIRPVRSQSIGASAAP
jgi:hypothetical protein